MKRYDPQKIERKWQAIWQEKGIYQAPAEPGKDKFYSLVMFPYPSGDLHIGHWYNFAPADVFTRFMRMNGKKILNPIGFDAFGLPAEGAAIQKGIHPAVWTKKNIQRMSKQLESMGASYDWQRVVVTCEPDYYRWTQWMFLQMYKHGLAYKKKATANWCPKCKSILANEQAEGGVCWRCESQVEQREIEQWFFKITKYADELLADLEKLDWPQKTKTMQKNWIGRSEGLEEYWQVEGMDLKLKTFTTWPHTTWGATFMVIAPEHPIIDKLVKDTKYEEGAKAFCQKAIQDKIKDPLNVEKKKEGFFLGRYVINHLSGWRMPLYIANFAIFEYGTGIVKCTPTHDQRDFEFARKYHLEFVTVIYPEKGRPLDPQKMKEAYTGEGYMMNAGQFNDIPTEKARKAIGDYTVKRGNGRWTINYHLRDWLVSRQRYWGAPIPMVYCSKCGVVPIPEKDLPVLLPKIENYLPVEGESPLARASEWAKTKCPQCAGPARRETDTMDTFVCSSWYFLRYADPKNEREFASKKALKTWLPVDRYIGGAEHTVLHLLYSRFFVKALRDMGYLDFDEPFLSLRHQGIILGEDGYKMSKSRGNVVDPDELVKKFGADTVRMYLCFMGPYNQGGPWSSKGIMGIWRFLNRVWRLGQETSGVKSADTKEVERFMHQTIKKVTNDIKKLKFNTAIAAIMEFVNQLSAISYQQSVISNQQSAIETLLLLLAPFAPHLTEELWVEALGKKLSIHQQSWPEYDERLAKEKIVTVVVQINGKLRDKLEVQSAKCKVQSEIKKLVKEREKVQKYLKGKKVKKVIFVPGRLINYVTG